MDRVSHIAGGTTASAMRKFAFMSMVVLSVYSVLSIIGFYLWFAFPVEKINGLTYFSENGLIGYYLIINFNDIVGVFLFSHLIYFRQIKTHTPIKDGIVLGGYLVVFSWILDLFVYVFIRNTLPSIEEYFLGKNQPEIGIAWLVAFFSAVCAGWLHPAYPGQQTSFSWKKAGRALLIIILVSALVTVIGLRYFDIKP
jgi:hypothetical protein